LYWAEIDDEIEIVMELESAEVQTWAYGWRMNVETWEQTEQAGKPLE
jgi:hypothetical protein